MRAIVASLVLAVALTGCAGKLPLTPGTTTPGGTVATGQALRLAGLEFKQVSAETARQMAQKASGAGATATGASMAAPAPAPMAPEAGRATDAKMASPYYYGSYFGGPFGNMKLDTVSEAKAPGAKGSWREVQTNVIAPVVADWAADARLVNTNGALGVDGGILAGQETYPGENSWNAVYASISRNEVLEFHVSAGETRVVRMSWKPVVIDIANLAVDPKEAIAKVMAAIKDQGFKSKEEQLGHDYFFNGDPTVGIAVPPIAAVATKVADAPVSSTEGSSGASSGVAIAPGEPAPYQPPTEEPVYELQSGGRWYVSLESIGDYTVWSLNYSPISQDYVERKPGETFVNNYAYGMVDAKTGDVIRLQRPMRVTMPKDMPVATPMAAPAATPKP